MLERLKCGIGLAAFTMMVINVIEHIVGAKLDRDAYALFAMGAGILGAALLREEVQRR